MARALTLEEQAVARRVLNDLLSGCLDPTIFRSYTKGALAALTIAKAIKQRPNVVDGMTNLSDCLAFADAAKDLLPKIADCLAKLHGNDASEANSLSEIKGDTDALLATLVATGENVSPP